MVQECPECKKQTLEWDSSVCLYKCQNRDCKRVFTQRELENPPCRVSSPRDKDTSLQGWRLFRYYLLFLIVIVGIVVIAIYATNVNKSQESLNGESSISPSQTPKANELVEPMSQDELQLSKVVGLSSANIPSGSYVSDNYLGSRTLEIKGKTLTMYCKAKTGNVEDFPQLGLHTYGYILYGKWGTNPDLPDVRGIHITDVVNGNTYSVPFKYLADYQIIVLSGDSYRIK